MQQKRYVYELQYSGAFILYQTPNLLVISKQQDCGMGRATCNCGLMFYVNYDNEERAAYFIAQDFCNEKMETSLKLRGKKYTILTKNCDFNGHTINNIFDDSQWYSTYHKGRHNMHSTIDCYTSGSKTDVYVLLNFQFIKMKLFLS